MRKLVKFTPLFLVLPFVTSCNSNNLTQEMFDAFKNDNITYHSDYEIYHYDKDNEGSFEYSQRYDVYTRFTQGLYAIEAYLYGENTLAVSDHFEKDDQGFATYSQVNEKNELIVTRALDGNGSLIIWRDSVYVNQLGKLKVENFSKISDNEYVYKLDDFGDNLPMSILHAAIPTSYFDLESMKIILKDNAIDSIVFQEKESEEPYAQFGYLYGRRVTLKVEDIGTTNISKNSAYEETSDNSSLGNALNEIRELKNYTINLSARYTSEQGEISLDLAKTFVTENDILREEYLGDEISKTGIHTYENELYSFEPYVSDYLFGSKVPSDITINSLLPTFDFSEYVFKYKGLDSEGNKIYSAYSSMNSVLSYVEFVDLTDSYYYPAGDLNFLVKDDHLVRIEFPSYLAINGEPVLGTEIISYSDFGITNINSSTWDKFIISNDELGELVGWDDPRLSMKFELLDGTVTEFTPKEVFEISLGEDTSNIPFFLKPDIFYETSGNASNDDEVVYLTLSNSRGTQEEFNYSKNILLENGFTSVSDGLGELFKKGNIIIYLALIDSNMMIDIEIPLGNFK